MTFADANKQIPNYKHTYQLDIDIIKNQQEDLSKETKTKWSDLFSLAENDKEKWYLSSCFCLFITETKSKIPNKLDTLKNNFITLFNKSIKKSIDEIKTNNPASIFNIYNINKNNNEDDKKQQKDEKETKVKHRDTSQLFTPLSENNDRQTSPTTSPSLNVKEDENDIENNEKINDDKQTSAKFILPPKPPDLPNRSHSKKKKNTKNKRFNWDAIKTSLDNGADNDDDEYLPIPPDLELSGDDDDENEDQYYSAEEEEENDPSHLKASKGASTKYNKELTSLPPWDDEDTGSNLPSLPSLEPWEYKLPSDLPSLPSWHDEDDNGLPSFPSLPPWDDDHNIESEKDLPPPYRSDDDNDHDDQHYETHDPDEAHDVNTRDSSVPLASRVPPPPPHIHLHDIGNKKTKNPTKSKLQNQALKDQEDLIAGIQRYKGDATTVGPGGHTVDVIPVQNLDDIDPDDTFVYKGEMFLNPSFLGSIKRGEYKLKKVETNKKPNTDSRSGLLDEIRQGKQLKKTNGPIIRKYNDSNNMGDAIKNALNKRTKAMNYDSDDDDNDTEQSEHSDFSDNEKDEKESNNKTGQGIHTYKNIWGRGIIQLHNDIHHLLRHPHYNNHKTNNLRWHAKHIFQSIPPIGEKNLNDIHDIFHHLERHNEPILHTAMDLTHRYVLPKGGTIHPFSTNQTAHAINLALQNIMNPNIDLKSIHKKATTAWNQTQEKYPDQIANLDDDEDELNNNSNTDNNMYAAISNMISNLSIDENDKENVSSGIDTFLDLLKNKTLSPNIIISIALLLLSHLSHTDNNINALINSNKDNLSNNDDDNTIKPMTTKSPFMPNMNNNNMGRTATRYVAMPPNSGTFQHDRPSFYNAPLPTSSSSSANVKEAANFISSWRFSFIIVILP